MELYYWFCRSRGGSLAREIISTTYTCVKYCIMVQVAMYMELYDWCFRSRGGSLARETISPIIQVLNTVYEYCILMVIST